jgi:hypothetical protein
VRGVPHPCDDLTDVTFEREINFRIALQQIHAHVFVGCALSEVREKKIAALIESME